MKAVCKYNIFIIIVLLSIIANANPLYVNDSPDLLSTNNITNSPAFKLFIKNKIKIEENIRANNIEEMQNVIFNMINENPQTLKYVYKYFAHSFERFNNMPLTEENTNLTQLITKLQKSIDNYEKSGLPEFPGIECLKLKIVENTDGDTFNTAKEFAEKYPQYEFTAYVINIMRDSINPKKPQQIKEYYETLILLIGKQPKKTSHIGTMRLMLKEKKKIEIFAPEVIEIL